MLGDRRLRGATVVSLTVVLLIGLALGSALAYQFRPQTTVTKTTGVNGVGYSTLTLTARSIYYYVGVLSCETVSGTAVTTYVNYGGTIGWTTSFNASLTAKVYVISITTEESARSTFYTQGSTPTC